MDVTQTPVLSHSGEFAVPSTPTSARISRPILDTPTRVTRVEEKNEFQRLNKRLEYYILCQKEREASTSGLRNELNSLREKSRADIAELKEIYDTQLSSSARARENLSQDLARLQDENGRLNREVSQLKSKLDVADNERNTLDTRGKERSTQLKDLQNKTIQLEDKVAQLVHQLQVERDSNKHLTASLEDARKNASVASTKLISEQSDAKTQIEKNSIKIVNLEQELALCRKELADIIAERGLIEDNLRRDFGQQLKDMLEDAHAAHKQETDEMLANQRNAFEARLQEYADDLDEQRKAVEDERRKKNDLLGDLAKIRAELADIKAQRDAARQEAMDLRATIEDVNAKAREHAEEADSKFSSLREMYRKKAEQFDAVLDDKITLAKEIKAYRALLENEETRLGYAAAQAARAAGAHVPASKSAAIPASRSSVTKTSSSTTTSTSTSTTSTSRADTTNSMLITGIDFDGTFIKLRNGSTDDVPLKDWSIKTRRRRYEFRFPPCTFFHLLLFPPAFMFMHKLYSSIFRFSLIVASFFPRLPVSFPCPSLHPFLCSDRSWSG